MNTRSRIISKFKVEARNAPQIEKLYSERDAFDRFVGGIANDEQWIADYVEDKQWKRLVSEAWNRFRANVERAGIEALKSDSDDQEADGDGTDDDTKTLYQAFTKVKMGHESVAGQRKSIDKAKSDLEGVGSGFVERVELEKRTGPGPEYKVVKRTKVVRK